MLASSPSGALRVILLAPVKRVRKQEGEGEQKKRLISPGTTNTKKKDSKKERRKARRRAGKSEEKSKESNKER